MTHISNNFCRCQALEWRTKPAETEKPGKRLNKNLHIYTWCNIIISCHLKALNNPKKCCLKHRSERSLIKEFTAGIQALSELLYTVYICPRKELGREVEKQERTVSNPC